jgi:hypothetical protein
MITDADADDAADDGDRKNEEHTACGAEMSNRDFGTQLWAVFPVPFRAPRPFPTFDPPSPAHPIRSSLNLSSPP